MSFWANVCLTLCLCFCAMASVSASDAPQGLMYLLDTKGMSEDWMSKTQAIQGHLAKLKPTDPRVKRFLPAIERRCKTLPKIKKINAHQQAIFTDMFAAMLEDLVKGEKVLARYAGQTINYGYWSDHINELTGTKMQVPPDYDSDKEYQMFMYYKLGGGMYWKTETKKWAGAHDEGAVVSPPYHPQAAMCQNTPETFHVWSALYFGVKGRMGVVNELEEITHAMAQDFAMSPDRVFLSGYSDGGFTSMWLATHYPHLVAGIVPGVANWQYVNTEYFSYFNFATLVMDGWRDGGYLQENLSRFLMLSNMGYDIDAIVNHHGHKVEWLKDEATVKRIMAWAKTKRRDLNRKHIKYSTWNLAWNRAFWFTIDRMVNPSYAAIVDAQIKGNEIHVKAKNIATFSIALNENLVDMNAPLKIFTNTALTYEGPAKAVVTVVCHELPQSLLQKSSSVHGDLSVHATQATYYNKKSNHKKMRINGLSWTFVGFTGGEDAEKARALLKIPTWARSDVDMPESLLERDNLFLFGGPLRNKFVAKIAGDLPVKFEEGKFSIGNRVYDEPQQWVKFMCANPLNPKKTCIIVAFNDLKAALAAKTVVVKGPMNLNPWSFRGSDCLVSGVRNPTNAYGIESGGLYGRDYIIFDSNWGAPDQTVIGTAEKDFMWGEVLQLKARAIKEKTGADVALYGGQPSFIQWKTHLNKGPLTINDIAATHPFPEFIMTCQLKGELLKAFVTPNDKGDVPVRVNTVFNKKTDPGYALGELLVSEIEDEKMYTVASGYALCDTGTLGLRGNTDKMPEPFFYFSDVEEFKAEPAAMVRGENLIQTEDEVTEAVVEYIKKRGSVSPPQSVGSLEDYIAYPQNNHFGSHDWLHVSLINRFKDPKGGSEIVRRMNVGIGVRAEGAEEVTEGYNTFIDYNVFPVKSQLQINMSGLSQKLPIEVSSTMKTWGIRGDAADASSVRLAAEEEAEIGRLQLMKITLENKSDKEVSIIQALGNTGKTKIFGLLWKGGAASKEGIGYARGYRKFFGDRKKPYLYECTLFVDAAGVPDAENLIIPSGYNHGLIGLKRDVTVAPHSSVQLPLLFVQLAANDFKKPVMNFDAIMSAFKDAIVDEINK